MMTPATCRAGRGLIGQSQIQLAAAARVGTSTVRNYEAGADVLESNVTAIRQALEDGGVEFIPDGVAPGAGKAGVRLR